MTKPRFEIDESDWPLLITENYEPYKPVVRFDCPEDSSGMDEVGKAIAKAARIALKIMNGGKP